MATATSEKVILGKVSGVFGVRGWVKVHAYTEPRVAILEFAPWFLQQGEGWRAVRLRDGRPHGKGVVASLEGIADRDSAAALVGAEIAIERGQLPPPNPGEYYWTDLIGLRVIGPGGVELGVVDHLLETGANDVLVVRAAEGERLIPFVLGPIVEAVDLAAGIIRVDWDPEF